MRQRVKLCNVARRVDDKLLSIDAYRLVLFQYAVVVGVRLIVANSIEDSGVERRWSAPLVRSAPGLGCLDHP